MFSVHGLTIAAARVRRRKKPHWHRLRNFSSYTVKVASQTWTAPAHTNSEQSTGRDSGEPPPAALLNILSCRKCGARKCAPALTRHIPRGCVLSVD